MRRAVRTVGSGVPKRCDMRMLASRRLDGTFNALDELTSHFWSLGAGMQGPFFGLWANGILGQPEKGMRGHKGHFGAHKQLVG